jgi:hypothetical protein
VPQSAVNHLRSVVLPGDDDLAVRRERHLSDQIRFAKECAGRSTRAEARVQRTVGVVADEFRFGLGFVLTDGNEGCSGSDDLLIGLNGNGRLIYNAARTRLLSEPRPGETRVQRTGGEKLPGLQRFEPQPVTGGMQAAGSLGRMPRALSHYESTGGRTDQEIIGRLSIMTLL